MYVHLGKLRDDDRLLWENVRTHLRLSPDEATDIREINADELSANFKPRLLDSNQRQKKACEIGITPLPADGNRDIDAELKADLQRAADQARATQRLNEYAEAGLEDTEANASAIRDFVNNSAVKGYWSVQIVDAAIANLGNKLTWRKAEAPTPPPAQPTEVLDTLPNGEPQLSLDADARTMRAASITQLRDLDKRRNGLRRPVGSFSSRF
jgi:hypothetical protein